MRHFLVVVIFIAGCVFFCGCIAVMVGAGIASGTIISDDTIELVKEAEFNHAWQISIETLKRMGTVEKVNTELNTITALVKGAKVKCVIDRVTPAVVRIQVTARKSLMPKIKVASEVINNLNSIL